MTRRPSRADVHLTWTSAILFWLIVSATGLAGVDLNDPSLETDEFWRDYYAKLTRLQQPLENNTSVNVTVQSGGRAALSCRVRHLGQRPVSWIRRRDFHVLTSRSHVFTADERVSVQHRVAGDEDWALSIWPVTAADSGVYECQVSTGQGTLSRLVNLTVVEPIARILGTEVHRIEEGSVITLLCVIDQATSEVGPIQWWRNNRTLVASGRVTVQSSSDGTAGSPQSQLHIRRASFLDSGLYTCGGDHLLSATVQLFVTEGDKTAAIQRRSPAGSRAAPAQLTLLLLCWLVPR